MNFASQSQDFKHRPRCPANSLALPLHHNDAAVPAEPPIQVLSEQQNLIQTSICYRLRHKVRQNPHQQKCDQCESTKNEMCNIFLHLTG